MNRITAIGLASLVAYGLLIGSKYAGFVSAAREDRASAGSAPASEVVDNHGGLAALKPLAPQAAVPMPAPVPRVQPVRASAAALEFRAARDLKAFADSLFSRRDSLTG